MSKLFWIIFILSMALEAWHFWDAPLPLLCLILPVATLFGLICKAEWLIKLPETHWLHRLPGFTRLSKLVLRAMSLDFAERIIVLMVCIGATWLVAVLLKP